MTIQSEDIKLLKSAVMADVPEGGGAMTGIEVVDGQSNNLFPDTSTDDRAGGRVRLRKVFGVAHTDNTEELLGASFAVLKPPEDPLVHVTMFETPGWADERDDAREQVERYLVKGPAMSCRIMDTHYAGSVILQLYQVSGANFPAAGDAIVLRNPNGVEQYVRVTKVTLSSGTYNVVEGPSVVSFGANVAVCELGQPLAFDVLGPPVERVLSASYATVYSTAASTGTAFYGVKPLAAPAAIGGRSVTVDGGIYTPLVPAATLEEPLIDIAPLTARQSLSRTAADVLTLPAETLTLQPGTVLRLPTAVEPGSLTLTRGATVFTDDGSGVLKQGTTAVGTIDYRGKSVTMAAGSPSYGSAATVAAYRPSTPSGAAVHSRELEITLANQGLGFVAAFEPPPAPGTFTLSYMAQGRWYDLEDNGNGKLAGADSSYGAGTLNYTTGSAAFTLGAIPDIGSVIIYQWGDAATAVAVNPASLPTRLQGTLQLDALTAARIKPETLVLSWTAGGAAKSATCNASGVISGDASGQFKGATVTLEPLLLPDGAVSATYDKGPTGSGAYVNNGGGSYTLGDAPLTPGTLRLFVLVAPQNAFELPGILNCYDTGTGIIYASNPGVSGGIGTVNYTTGAVTISPSVAMDVYERVVQNYASGSNTLFYEARVLRGAHTVELVNATVSSFSYAYGSLTPGSASATPTWGLAIPVLTGLSLATDSLAFGVGGQVYTAAGGTLVKGWALTTGAGTPAGSVGSGGTVGITSLPAGGSGTAVTWSNASQNRATGRVGFGVFRVQSAPIKVGVMQLQAGALVGSSNNAGVISGGGWSGTVDFQRGIVRWSRTASYTMGAGWLAWDSLDPIPADELTYNAVFLQYLPMDGALLGLDTARLPLDGKVPIYRQGGQVIVHNTLTTALPNPLTKGTAYPLGRERIAAVTVRQASGAKVPASKYTVNFDAGTLTVPTEADIDGLAQPFTVHHRIEDELMVLRADISGKLDLVSTLTHDYPADTSYVSSKLRKGDLFARAFNYREQVAWTGVWSDTRIGAAPTASFNQIDFPITTTNRGAITERWAVIFTGATQVRVVGENVGQILTNVSITAPISPLNPQTGAPYFTISELGWGGGWSAGNVLPFNTAAAGAPAWVALCVLQGPPSVASDAATIAFRCDVDA